MAHEFGHFCQSGYIASYSYVASKIIVKPAKNGRPAIRITYIRAGEPSPLVNR
jgi:hypothetical protein